MDPENSSRSRATPALLLAACLFFPATTLVWLFIDRSSPNWDDAWYLTNSLQMFDKLVDHGVLGYAKGFLSVLGFKAPLITALPTPFYLIFGRHWHAAFLVNVVSMIVLFVAVYSIGNKLGNSRVGLLAVFIVGTMPLLYGLSRWFLVEYTLTAVVATTIAIIVLSDNLEGTWSLLCCGVTIGIGLLLKASFPLYVAAPLAYAFIKGRRSWRAWLMLGAPIAMLALPWYAVNYRATLANALDAAYGTSAIIQGTGPIFALSSITSYLWILARKGPSEYYVAIALIATAFAFARRGTKTDRRHAWLLVALWLAPFLVFLLGGNKDVRYVAPLLPAFALATSLAIEAAMESVRWRAALTCFVLVYPLLAMTSVSFGLPYRSTGLGYAHLYSRRGWPQSPILILIAQQAPVRPGERIRLLIASDRGMFNANNFELAAVGGRLPFDVSTLAYEKDLAAVVNAVDSASFIVYKEGGEPESPFFGRFYSDMVEHVRHDARFTEIPFGGGTLPDGGTVRIFRNVAAMPAQR